MVVADETSRRAMKPADMSKKDVIVVMPTTVPDPPKAGGVEVAHRTSKGNLLRTTGIVAKKDAEKASAGRSAPIQRNLHSNQDQPNREIDSDRTTLRAPSEPETEQARPS